MTRWLFPVYGAAVFIWLQIEDNAVLPVVLLGAAGALLVVLRRERQRTEPSPLIVVVNATLAGAIAGVGAALVTTFLMLIKTGLHSHVFPDYPLAQMLAILQRAPAWALAGALSGIGIALGTGSGRKKPCPAEDVKEFSD